MATIRYLTASIPARFYKDHVAEYGSIPRWNPLILGGLPFIDAMHGDTFYPAAWLKFVMPLHRALGHKLVWHVFLARSGHVLLSQDAQVQA